MSAMTIWMTLLAGNNHPRAWAVGLINQVFCFKVNNFDSIINEITKSTSDPHV
jgi:hypothetical protein